jgi:hypothetical protein
MGLGVLELTYSSVAFADSIGTGSFASWTGRRN